MILAGFALFCVLIALGYILIAENNLKRSYAILAIGLLHVSLSFIIIRTQLFQIDALSQWILIILSLLFLGVCMHSIGYFSVCQHENNNKTIAISLILFITFATSAILARDLIAMWIFLESASLSCAPLIYYTKSKASIEATWKYLFLCSIGIVLALIGMLFISYAAILEHATDTSLSFSNIFAHVHTFNPVWLKLSFVFIFIGFATKTGLFPLHAWKLDAYAEAPGIFGGLMAGGMTALSWLALMRLMQIMNAAGEGTLMRTVLVFFGITSVIYASIGMLNQYDIKRVLAYSSIEHMGLIALGLGVGGVGVVGALFHVFNNALLKGAIFMSMGNVKYAFTMRSTFSIKGVIATLPITGTLILLAFFAIVGTPPFGSFGSLFSIINGIAAYSTTLLGFIVFGLIMAFIGMSKTIMTLTRGAPKSMPKLNCDTPLMYGSSLFFLMVVLVVGLWMPRALETLLHQCAFLLGEH